MMEKRLAESQIAARRADAWDAAPTCSIWHHKKSGGVYEVKGVALASGSLEPVIIYSKAKGVSLTFTRPASEFVDGRFERDHTQEQEK